MLEVKLKGSMITKTNPYEHQLTAYNKAWNKEYFALFMEMGTGKTKVSIDLGGNYFNDMQIDAVLVIAPNTVHRQWANEEIPKHCPVPFTSFVWSASKASTKKYQAEKDKFYKSDKLKFLCVNVETFGRKLEINNGTRKVRMCAKNSSYIEVRDFLKKNRCLMIIDESTVIKNPDANRTKNILRLSDYSVRRLILTGTPVTNSPFDLWSQFSFLREGFFGCNWFIFKHRYALQIKDVSEGSGGTSKDKDKTFFRNMYPWEIIKCRNRVRKLMTDHMEVDKITEEDKLVMAVDQEDAIEQCSVEMGITEKNVHYIFTHEDIKYPYKGLAKLKAKIAPHTYTVKKADCKDVNIPEKIYQPIYAEMTAEQKKIYNQTKKLMMSKYADKSLTVMNKLSLMLRLQQITGGFFPYDPENGEKKPPVLIGKETAKYKRLKTDLEQVALEDKIIIWSNFTAEIEYLHKMLSKLYPYDRVETYYGGTSKNKGFREGIIEDFKAGDIKILIANPASAGIGLNLQKSSLHYYYSNGFSLEKRLQSEDRSHRIGQTQHVVYKDIIITGSIDDKIHEALSTKKDLLEFFREKSLKELLDDKEILF